MTEIRERLIRRIRSEGPVSIAAYMAEALFDPREGFYATRDPIGAGADFITAPEVSQMFGELIGLWCVEAWRGMGAPDPFHLIELGPGRGTMMSDALRAARLDEGFARAARVHLVEASPALKNVQAQTLASAPFQIGWADALEDVPAGPSIILGNEFLDCLPLRQFVKHGGEWRERLIGFAPDTDDTLAFVLSHAPASALEIEQIAAPLRDAPEGALVETRPGDASLVDAIARRFRADPGRALLIDYGPADSETGDTFQAIKSHEKVDPLTDPGKADLTARVDFGALKRAAEAAGLSASAPVEQGAWLTALGIEQRAAALSMSGKADRGLIVRQLHRLTSDDQMGTLFKAMCLSAPELPSAPGF